LLGASLPIPTGLSSACNQYKNSPRDKLFRNIHILEAQWIFQYPNAPLIVWRELDDTFEPKFFLNE
jgi:hypothetical protein